MAIEQNKELARKFFAALNNGDSDFIMDAYAEDVVTWTAGSMPFSGAHTKAEVSELIPWIFGEFPDGLKFSIKDMTAEGERVAIEAESKGMHTSGNLYHQHYHFLMVICNGKIHEFKEYMDTMHANEILVGGQI